jgi:hypothetical protein
MKTVDFTGSGSYVRAVNRAGDTIDGSPGRWEWTGDHRVKDAAGTRWL